MGERIHGLEESLSNLSFYRWKLLQGFLMLAAVLLLGSMAPTYEVQNFEFETDKTHPEKPIKINGLEHRNSGSLPENVSVRNHDVLPELVDEDNSSFKLFVDNISERQERIIENHWFRYTVGDDEFFKNYAVERVNDSEISRLDMNVELEDSRVSLGDPAELNYTLTNPSDQTWRVLSGTYSPPFSTQDASLEGSERIFMPLWRDRYAKDKSRPFPRKALVLKTLGGKHTAIDPGDFYTQIHQITYQSPGLREGTYTINETLDYAGAEGQEEIRYIARFEIEKNYW